MYTEECTAVTRPLRSTGDLRRSLVHPDEDFVVIAPLVDNGKTKVISGEELKQIKEHGVEPKKTGTLPSWNLPMIRMRMRTMRMRTKTKDSVRRWIRQ